MLFGKLLPRESSFIELFNQHGGFIIDGGRAFIPMLQGTTSRSCEKSTPTL